MLGGAVQAAVVGSKEVNKVLHRWVRSRWLALSIAHGCRGCCSKPVINCTARATPGLPLLHRPHHPHPPVSRPCLHQAGAINVRVCCTILQQCVLLIACTLVVASKCLRSTGKSANTEAAGMACHHSSRPPVEAVASSRLTIGQQAPKHGRAAAQGGPQLVGRRSGGQQQCQALLSTCTLTVGRQAAGGVRVEGAGGLRIELGLALPPLAVQQALHLVGIVCDSQNGAVGAAAIGMLCVPGATLRGGRHTSAAQSAAVSVAPQPWLDAAQTSLNDEQTCRQPGCTQCSQIQWSGMVAASASSEPSTAARARAATASLPPASAVAMARICRCAASTRRAAGGAREVLARVLLSRRNGRAAAAGIAEEAGSAIAANAARPSPLEDGLVALPPPPPPLAATQHSSSGGGRDCLAHSVAMLPCCRKDR